MSVRSEPWISIEVFPQPAGEHKTKAVCIQYQPPADWLAVHLEVRSKKCRNTNDSNDLERCASEDGSKSH